jgi:hypothetical protein
MIAAFPDGEGVVDDRHHETVSRPAGDETSHSMAVTQKGGVALVRYRENN